MLIENALLVDAIDINSTDINPYTTDINVDANAIDGNIEDIDFSDVDVKDSTDDANDKSLSFESIGFNQNHYNEIYKLSTNYANYSSNRDRCILNEEHCILILYNEKSGKLTLEEIGEFIFSDEELAYYGIQYFKDCQDDIQICIDNLKKSLNEKIELKLSDRNVIESVSNSNNSLLYRYKNQIVVYAALFVVLIVMTFVFIKTKKNYQIRAIDDEKFKTYMENLLKTGYTQNDIIMFLVNRGYNRKRLEEIMKEI